jgi:[CysO sulfur-carrier protein]-S-L-cysteine hydrolase
VIEIPQAIRDEMVECAFGGLPNEACGILAGPDGKVEAFYPMTNADQSEMTYRLDAKEQLRVFNEIEDKSWNLLAIFHSHTHTEAYPSETDRRQAFYPEAHYLLVSLSDRENPVLRGYTIRDGDIREEEVVVR